MKNIPEKTAEKPFSVLLFAVTITATLVLFALVFRFVAPGVWDANFAAPFWKWGIVFLCAHMCLGFGEEFFHRYMLHAPFPLFWWFPPLHALFARLHRQHTLHHKLTDVVFINVVDGKGKVFCRYPILVEKQHEASYFPWWSLAAFTAGCLLVIIALQVLLSDWPIVAGTILAITWSVVLYEIVHMAEHLPFETFWKPKVTHPRFGKYWTSFYCFHMRHHLNVKDPKRDYTVNENISGFFGIPIADFVLGTYAPWPRVPVHGELVLCEDFEANTPRPCFLIRFLDRHLLA